MARGRNPFGGGDDEGYDPRRGGMGVPMIIMREGGGDHYPSQPQTRHADDPPARVQMAMEFLKLCKMFEAVRPVVYPVASTGEAQSAECEKIPGMELTEEEKDARAEAATTMRHYFAGTLKMDVWEQLDSQLAPVAGMVCFCVNPSTGQASRNCPLCGGKGDMKIVLDPTRIQQMALQASNKEVTRQPGTHPELTDKPDNKGPRRKGGDAGQP